VPSTKFIFHTTSRSNPIDVFLPDGINVNWTLVKDGWSCRFRKYAPGDTVLEGLEKEARGAKNGWGLICSWDRRGSGGTGTTVSRWTLLQDDVHWDS
jgi:hypothetical protein